MRKRADISLSDIFGILKAVYRSFRKQRIVLPDCRQIRDQRIVRSPPHCLPVYYLVNDRLLLAAAPAKIDSGGFNAFMSQKIGQKCNITAAFNEILGKTVAEGVGINHSFVQRVPDCQSLKLPPYAAGRNAHAGMV